MSKLLDLLPPYWAEHALMRDFAKSIGRPLDEWRLMLRQLHIYFDPESAPESWLDALMATVGLPRNDALTSLQKRALIATAFESWIWKGTPLGVEGYVRAVTSQEAEVVRVNNHAFVAGVNLAGDICGPGELAWTWELHVPAAAGYSESEIRALVTPVVSSLESFTVVFF